MKLNITITAASPAWALLLDQIGIPWEVLGSSRTDPRSTAVWIVSRENCAEHREALQQYLTVGGAAMMEADTAKALFGIPVQRRYLQYIYAEADAIFGNIPVSDIHRLSLVPADAAHLSRQGGKPIIAVSAIGKGRILILPSGFIDTALDYGTRRVNFPPGNGERFPSERVARIGKHGIRRVIQMGLRHLFHYRGFPFVHLSPFPRAETGLFAFRIDTDFGERKDIDKLYQLCREYKIPASWFVETRSAESRLSQFAEMKAQEIAYHCYRHRIFPGYKRNKADFQSGLALLKQNAIQPVGYAAPYGEWHPALGALVEEYDFRYSSEFSLGFDDLPFYPYLNGHFSKVLQIPIHPISVGRLRWARFSEAQMIAYYLNRLTEKVNAREPAIFYHHPGQQRWAVFESLFREVQEQSLPAISLGDYAEWWNKRQAFSWHAHLNKDKIEIEYGSFGKEIAAIADYPDGRSEMALLNSKTPFAQECVPIAPMQLPRPYSPERLRKYTKQMLVHDLTWHYGKSKQ